MAHDHGNYQDPNERLTLGARAGTIYVGGLAVGFIGLVLAVLIGWFSDHTFKRFFFAYLVSFAFFLSLSIGGLLFTLVHFMTRAGWSVAVRRIAETMASATWVLFVLSAPILVSVGLNNGVLYRWAQPLHLAEGAEAKALAGTSAVTSNNGEQHESAQAPAQESAAANGSQAREQGKSEVLEAIPKSHSVELSIERSGPQEGEAVNYLTPDVKADLIAKKQAWLQPWFFIVRMIVYMAIFAVAGWWYWRRSVEQDTSGNDAITHRLMTPSAPLFLVSMLTATFASIDLLMTLDPAWYSTMFPLIYFAGCVVGVNAAIIVIARLLQKAGYLTGSISTEHYHDLGKWLFAFTFFWGYVSFSQYMLTWYANIPEETGYFIRRGCSTSPSLVNAWSWWSIALLCGHLLIPFAALLTRHTKRNLGALMFWACWLLLFHWVDLYWYVMPELDGNVHFGIIEILCFLGIGGVWVATLVRTAARHALRPTQDPRLIESLAFRNM